MEALFVHDHIFYRDTKNNFYTSGKLPYEIWTRYLKSFDKLTIAARVKDIDDSHDLSKLNLSSGPNVSFLPLPSISSATGIIKHKRTAKERLFNKISSIDAVIVRLPSELGSLATSISQKLNKPYAVEVVAYAWDALWNYGSLVGKLYAPWANMRVKKQVSRAPFALYVTEKYLQSKYPTHGVTTNVSNVELLPFDTDIILSKRINRIRTTGKVIRVGLIASLSSEYKGIDTAINALKEVKLKTSTDFELHILGDGDKSKWEELAKVQGIQDNIFFDGTLPAGNPVYEWLDSIDIYIHPSKQEGLPRAVIEAMSRGCPIIASSVAGIPELISAENLHSPGDISKLTSLLVEKIGDFDWYEEQANRNIKVSEKYLKPTLDNRRNNFWLEFSKYASQK
ncbi:glycosyltransferase [Terribacillus saccharophilus]|uniref:glycosyltransferase n=1 Tax=Terribacillus saccharophilus TaxID=361277 RepID=UPI00398257EF